MPNEIDLANLERPDMFLDAGFQIHRELEGDMTGIVIVRRNLTNQHSVELSNSV